MTLCGKRGDDTGSINLYFLSFDENLWDFTCVLRSLGSDVSEFFLTKSSVAQGGPSINFPTDVFSTSQDSLSIQSLLLCLFLSGSLLGLGTGPPSPGTRISTDT